MRLSLFIDTLFVACQIHKSRHVSQANKIYSAMCSYNKFIEIIAPIVASKVVGKLAEFSYISSWRREIWIYMYKSSHLSRNCCSINNVLDRQAWSRKDLFVLTLAYRRGSLSIMADNKDRDKASRGYVIGATIWQ